MNEKKLKQLFASARNEPAPAPSPDFPADVLRAVRRESPPVTAAPLTIWDHLNKLFPRVALAAAAVIVLCVAADYTLTVAGLPDVRDGTAQITSQFLFNSDDL
jgi:hypothetical protein